MTSNLMTTVLNPATEGAVAAQTLAPRLGALQGMTGRPDRQP